MKRIFREELSKTKKGVIHSVILIFLDDDTFLPKESSCTCDWGYWWRWGKKNKTLMCIHITDALKKHAEENGIKKIELEITPKDL